MSLSLVISVPAGADSSALHVLYARTPNNVTASGRQLLVNSDPFTVKGVVYTPVPVGADPETAPPYGYGDYYTSAYSSIYNRDLPLLSAMGANTIRVLGWDNLADHTDFLDAAYAYGIKVIPGFWVNAGQDISQESVRDQIASDFRDMVSVHKDHPAILMWAIGNDLNAGTMYGGDLANVLNLTNGMSTEAHAEDTNHPVTTPLADEDLIDFIMYNDATSNIDIWGANVYRGNTFGTLFTDYEAYSGKPLIITGYGADAYDSMTEMESESGQSDYAAALWGEIEANADVCTGGTIMEYSDQWWKGKYSADPGCTDINPAVHGVCGYAPSEQPDGYDNYEWWGIMRYSVTNPEIVEPRAIYTTLQTLWTTP